jgi:hypothetical protein
MGKLRKNKTFRKKRLDKDKNKDKNKNNTKKRLKGGSRETTLKKLKKIETMKTNPKIKIEIHKNHDPEKKPFLLMLNRLHDKKYTHIPNIIETSTYTFDNSVENAVKIIFPGHMTRFLKERYTYTIIFDENNKTIISIIIEFDSNDNKYITELSAHEYEIKIDYLQDKEITEGIVEEISENKNVTEDLQRNILSYLSNNDRVNIL